MMVELNGKMCTYRSRKKVHFNSDLLSADLISKQRKLLAMNYKTGDNCNTKGDANKSNLKFSAYGSPSTSVRVKKVNFNDKITPPSIYFMAFAASLWVIFYKYIIFSCISLSYHYIDKTLHENWL